ncbi:phosphopantothenoylcysteine decarboxylase, partial [Klebsiella pneumoniae]|uniref:phosphopantothenoylcysteine decarboxylase domain-containing protein n=1 Tax=Klebsiella pneumoniae TaxID=573 RepID=UPI0022EB10BB
DALVAAGYLHKADTLAALAQQLGLDAQTLSKTVARYNRDAAQHFASPVKDLQHLNLMITAGPTREPLDPVRYITNHSSGKM